jgi:hypothetical protein
MKRWYLPWYRIGFATALAGRPTAGQARASLPARIELNAGLSATELPVELAGPGDVVGLDPLEIRRCEPYDGCPDFEPGYFPYVELVSADLPWRFSPTGPEERDLADPEIGASRRSTRLQPWLALVVVPEEAASVAPAPAGGLPTLTTSGEQLPPVGESWAWAHVQVALDDGSTLDTDAALTGALADPSRTVTRLVCPRRLEAATRYGAFLVPTWAAGKAVLHPDAVGPDPLAPAWASTGDVTLPIYFRWSFATNAAGTFELLARSLEPQPAPEAAAGRVLDTAAPGWGVVPQIGRSTIMQGALRPLGTSEPAADASLAEALRTAISSPPGITELLPPIYGQDFNQGLTSLTSTEGWIGELNTDPRRRLAAGLATWAVNIDQENLADEAWQQLGDHDVPDRAVAASRDLADVITGTLKQRHQPVTVVAPTALRVARARHALPALLTAWSPQPAEVTRPADAAAVVAAPPTSTSFAPAFNRPAYELLRAVAPEWLLPGGSSIPMNSVIALRSNHSFVEAFLVGLNHALGQELAWRGYPLELGATMFSQFWGHDANTPTTTIRDWHPESELGSHMSGADALVLLIRGAFVARFPTARLTLSRSDGAGIEQSLEPHFRGRLGVDATFVGFPLTLEQATAPITDGGTSWRVVIEEAVGHVRLGVDEPGDTSPALASWQDLDWSHPHLSGRNHVKVAGSLFGLTRPVSDGASDIATWGLSSGHLACALQQPAFRLLIPLALWLPGGDG